jgi:hypothetical protein
VGTWIPVVVAVVSALAAAGAASRSVRAQRMLELERRIAVSRGEIFEPLVEAFMSWWDLVGTDELDEQWFTDNVMPTFKEFIKWVQIYGSDETVWIVHRYMQAIYANAPVNVAMRLYAELIIAARKELGFPDTRVTALDILGLRIHDIYGNGVPLPIVRLSERQLYAHEDWSPPWGDRFKYGKPTRPRG